MIQALPVLTKIWIDGALIDIVAPRNILESILLQSLYLMFPITFQSIFHYSLESISGESFIAEAFSAAGRVNTGGVGVASAISGQAFVDVVASESVAGESRQTLASKTACVTDNLCYER